MASFRICCFHTGDYTPLATRLLDSCKQFGLPYHAEAIEDFGSWARNTAYKPRFLLSMLERFPTENIVYLDADAIIRQYPELFERIEGDVALHFTSRIDPVRYRLGRLLGQPKQRRYSHKVLTGTIFLRNTASSRSFIKAWIEEAGNMPGREDQDSAERAIDISASTVFSQLPFSYVHIHDHPGEGVVIEHFQASRQFNAPERRRKRQRRRIARILFVFSAVLASATAWLYF